MSFEPAVTASTCAALLVQAYTCAVTTAAKTDHTRITLVSDTQSHRVTKSQSHRSRQRRVTESQVMQVLQVSESHGAASQFFFAAGWIQDLDFTLLGARSLESTYQADMSVHIGRAARDNPTHLDSNCSGCSANRLFSTTRTRVSVLMHNEEESRLHLMCHRILELLE